MDPTTETTQLSECIKQLSDRAVEKLLKVALEALNWESTDFEILLVMSLRKGLPIRGSASSIFYYLIPWFWIKSKIANLIGILAIQMDVSYNEDARSRILCRRAM